MATLYALGTKMPAGADVGGKARGLAQLFDAGVPCPAGVVVPAASVAALRAGDQACITALLDACRPLRFPVVVRSSASIEDSELGAAPGLFSSMTDIASAEEIPQALECVARSAESEAVKTYCSLRGIDSSSVIIGAIIQEQVPTQAAGTLYTRAPGDPHSATMVCDIDAGPTMTLPRSGEATAVSLPQWQALRELALRCETAIGADGGADIEWAIDGNGALWIVQARPIIHPPAAAPPSPELFEFSVGDPRVWRWDVIHNPDPLSPAQASLVRLVSGHGIGGEMRVVGGYLYYAESKETSHEQTTSAVTDDLAALFTDEILPSAFSILAPHEGRSPPQLPSALVAYTEITKLYADVIRPTLRRGRELLRSFIAPVLGDETDDAMTALLTTRSDRHLAARIRRVARGEETVESLLEYAAPMSPAWDVAAATFAEDPSPVLQAVELHRRRRDRTFDTAERHAHALRLLRSLGVDQAEELDARLAVARQAQELGEVDDHIFFRAQSMIRRTLLGIAARWQLPQRDDIFYVELEWLSEHESSSAAPSELEERVRHARATRKAEREITMPLELQGGAAIGEERALRGGDAWRGIGTGGRARGPVVKVDDFGRLPKLQDGSVVVARSLSPSLIFAVAGAAAVVSVYGGPLGHGAAMARELEIPCIVQCTGAWRSLQDGDDVWVDGDSGWLVRLG